MLWKAGSGFPVDSCASEAALHLLPQGVHPSAVEALGLRNGQLPARWSLLTPPQTRDQSAISGLLCGMHVVVEWY